MKQSDCDRCKNGPWPCTRWHSPDERGTRPAPVPAVPREDETSGQRGRLDPAEVPALRPIVWLLDRGDGIRRVELHEMEQRDASVLYAVRQAGFTLNTDGEWEYEPQPSSRDDDYIARNRYASRDAAVAAFVRLSSGREDNHLNKGTE